MLFSGSQPVLVSALRVQLPSFRLWPHVSLSHTQMGAVLGAEAASLPPPASSVSVLL